MPQFHESILQEAQTPLCSACWRFTACQGDKMCFVFTIQSMLVFSIRFLALQGNFQTLFQKSFSYFSYGNSRHIESFHNPLIGPVHLHIGLEQNLGSLHLSSRSFS